MIWLNWRGESIMSSLGFQELLSFFVILIVLALWIWAVIDLLKNEFSGLALIKWISIVIIMPVAGFILYFLIGRKKFLNKKK